jgi:hypothetical protein
MSIRRRTGNRNRLGSSNRDLGWFTNRHALIRRFTEYVNGRMDGRMDRRI